MKIGAPKEHNSAEARVSLTPSSARQLADRRIDVVIESGLGDRCGWADPDYLDAGAMLATSREALFQTADVVLQVRPPPPEDVPPRKRGSIHLGLLDPFHNAEIVTALAGAGVSAISLELIPRSTRAQKMDVLSSQANLAGYVAVIVAAEKLDRIFPLMMTAAGTIAPARVFVIGAGVAGLQAIATAKRLGARVEAYDTRPAVAEEVRSVGGRFVEIDLGTTGQTQTGYAKALTDAQLRKQREAMTEVCARSDVIITTAQVFGRKAPLLVTEAMLDAVHPGAVVVDLAIESGGNVHGMVADQVVDRRGIKLIGYTHLPGRVPVHASQVFASNVANLVLEYWDEVSHELHWQPDDDILKDCLITHAGEIVNSRFQAHP